MTITPREGVVPTVVFGEPLTREDRGDGRLHNRERGDGLVPVSFGWRRLGRRLSEFYRSKGTFSREYGSRSF